MCHPGVRTGLGKPASVGGWPGGSASMPPPIAPITASRIRAPRNAHRVSRQPSRTRTCPGSLTRPPVPPGAGRVPLRRATRSGGMSSRTHAMRHHTSTPARIAERPLEPPLPRHGHRARVRPEEPEPGDEHGDVGHFERDEPSQPRHREREPRQEPQRVLRRVHLVRQQEADQQRHAARPPRERRIAAALQIDRDERRDEEPGQREQVDVVDRDAERVARGGTRWYQKLSKSGVRAALKLKNSHHGAGRGDRERQVDRDPRARRPPEQSHRSIRLPILQPLQEQRHEHQRRVELRRGAEPDQHARPPVSSFRERDEGGRRAGHRREIPVDRAVHQQGGGEREPQRPRASEEPETKRGHHGEPEQEHRVRVEEGRVVVAREPRRDAHQVHRQDRVLVAVVLRGFAPVEERKAPAGELLGREQGHDVGVAEQAILPPVAEVPSRTRGLQGGADRHGPEHTGEHHADADRATSVPHAAHRIRGRCGTVVRVLGVKVGVRTRRVSDREVSGRTAGGRLRCLGGHRALLPVAGSAAAARAGGAGGLVRGRPRRADPADPRSAGQGTDPRRDRTGGDRRARSVRRRPGGRRRGRPRRRRHRGRHA